MYPRSKTLANTKYGEALVNLSMFRWLKTMCWERQDQQSRA